MRGPATARPSATPGRLRFVAEKATLQSVQWRRWFPPTSQPAFLATAPVLTDLFTFDGAAGTHGPYEVLPVSRWCAPGHMTSVDRAAASRSAVPLPPTTVTRPVSGSAARC